jgi:molybdopterin/thiamine biosynthesis adenylyltransferase
VFDSLVSVDGFAAVRSADFVFGCIDSEGARFILNELCATYGRPYLDLASDIIPGEHVEYGGRVCVSINGGGCIQCFGILDTKEAGEDLAGESERRNRAAVYGVQREFLGRSGPSVVSINGVIASLAITEFIATITGIREPQRLLTYKGTSGKVFAGITQSSQECFICNGLRGTGQTSDVERYIRNGTRERLRRSSGTNASVLQTKEQISSMNAAAASSPENETTLVLRETIQQQ